MGHIVTEQVCIIPPTQFKAGIRSLNAHMPRISSCWGLTKFPVKSPSGEKLPACVGGMHLNGGKFDQSTVLQLLSLETNFPRKPQGTLGLLPCWLQKLLTQLTRIPT